MTIEELGDVLDLQLRIIRYPGQNNRYSATFDHAEIKANKHSAVLISMYGNGITPQSAIIDYTEQISGKWLVIGASSNKQREFGVPKLTTY